MRFYILGLLAMVKTAWSFAFKRRGSQGKAQSFAENICNFVLMVKVKLLAV